MKLKLKHPLPPAKWRLVHPIHSDSDIDIIDELFIECLARGWTVKHLANLSGVTATTLYAWFSGRTYNPHYVTLTRVASALGWKLTWAK